MSPKKKCHLWRREEWNGLSDQQPSDLQIHTKQDETLEMVKNKTQQNETIDETLLKGANWKWNSVLYTVTFLSTIEVKDAKKKKN